MIGFRDDEPTYLESAQALAKKMETPFQRLDDRGRMQSYCRMCDELEDDCNRYSEWCLGRTARATKDNPGWRLQFVDQLWEVLASS